jgi:hypothetical protein
METICRKPRKQDNLQNHYSRTRCIKYSRNVTDVQELQIRKAATIKILGGHSRNSDNLQIVNETANTMLQ